MHADQLAAEFGIAGAVDFSNTADGLVKARVEAAGATAELYLQGAHIVGWQPAGMQPVLFISPNSNFAPGKAIRGGIPIIFPWFGPHRTAPGAPQHGFVRAAPWRLDAVERGEGGAVTVEVSYATERGDDLFWPEACRVSYRIGFGPKLTLRLAVQNRAGRPIVFEEALHTYFAVSDVARIAVAGLQGREYIDKTDGGRRKRLDAAELTLHRETDSVFLDVPDRLELRDPGWQRRIVIDKTGAASAIVWNPWADKAKALADLGADCWRGMVCVETGNALDNEVHLAADSEHVLTTAIGVDAGT